ncbi:MAG: isoprenylcysteine carboxylmethyltransferase family protein [Planctomycetes bacterium]|nr:isoprenylcysteine carboxylmethyltransferase family protein [Planctomycetota bacterium]
MASMPLVLRAALFTLVAPVTVGGLLPWWLARGSMPEDWGPWRHAGWPLMAAGMAGYLWCARDFVVRGGGTPNPLDAPVRFVASGLYRHVRNPMYVAIGLVIAGQACLAESRAPLLYALALWPPFHGFVTLYEEPHLRRLFGAPYEEYLRRVPRWLPSLRARA